MSFKAIVIPGVTRDLGVCCERQCRCGQEEPRSVAALGMTRLIPALLLCLAVALTACDRDQSASQVRAQNAPSIEPAETKPKLFFPPDNSPPPTFDSSRAFQ